MPSAKTAPKPKAIEPMRKAMAIINPAAAAGRANGHWQQFKAVFDGEIDFNECFTIEPGHAAELTRNALQNGHSLVLAVGGDGTVNEVANGFLADGLPINPSAELAIVPRGTGTDFVRTLAVPQTPEELLEAIRKRNTRALDLGAITCHSHDDREITRYFINVADCGYGGALLQRYGSLNRILPGPPAYFLGLLINLFTYKNPLLHFRIDGGETQTGRCNALIAANAQYFGGGMWIAPTAEVDDGYFEIIQIGDVSKFEVLANVRRIYNGTLCEHPKVRCVRAKKLEVWSDETVLLDVDGELPGKLPATFEIVPGAIRVVTA